VIGADGIIPVPKILCLVFPCVSPGWNDFFEWGFRGSLFFGEVVVMGMGIFNVVEYLRDYGGFSSISVFLSILGYYSCILGMHFHIFGGKNVLRKLQQYAIES